MKRILAVILAGGEGERLSILSAMRAKPAVPFGGKYRIIDFALSNCVNSDINHVLALTQYNPRSLHDHIRAGRSWDLDRNQGGIQILQPYVSRNRANEWYRGTADAVLRNLEFIQRWPADLVLVLAGDHIYKMDYGPFVTAHRRHRADVTIAVRTVPLEEAHRFGILALDDADRVVDWQEKPRTPKSNLASMGIYVFSKRALAAWLDEARPDFGAHVIPAMLAGGARVHGFRFNGYWQDVGTIESYWQANMDLLEERPQLDLYDLGWLIHTRSEERAAAKIGPTASVHRSLVSHGCIIYGTVEHSILSPGVRIDPGAVVRDSIVMGDTVIRAGAIVDRAIIDKDASIGPNAVIGEGDDMTPNRQEPSRLNTGITVIGKGAAVPRGVRLGRNVKIGQAVRTADFHGRIVRSGETVERHPDPPRRGRAEAAPGERPLAAIPVGITAGAPDRPGVHHGRGNGRGVLGERREPGPVTPGIEPAAGES